MPMCMYAYMYMHICMDSSRSKGIPQAINAFKQEILGKISSLISNKVVQMKHPEKTMFCQTGKDKRQMKVKCVPRCHEDRKVTQL